MRATFDYDDDDDDDDDGHNEVSSSIDEQMNNHKKYQLLFDSLVIAGLGKDLGLDQNVLAQICQLSTLFNDSTRVDEFYEQLYPLRDFELFQNMIKRKNLVFQSQTLLS